MKIRLQLAQLLQALVAWLRRFACRGLQRKPVIPTNRFKLWLNPVSRPATPSGTGHWRSKPDWVRLAVFDLALALPGAGYRTIANCFNLQQVILQSQQTAQGLSSGWCKGDQLSTSVSKTFVAKLLTGQRAALAHARHHAHSCRQARREPVLTTWGMDLTGLPLTDGSSTPVFGVIDHGSPWQNGRIERFWRTLKSELRSKAIRSRFNGQAIQTRMKFASVNAMQSLLEAFKLSYNAYRPHQSLQGLTPAMAWSRQMDAAKLKLKTKPKPTSAAQSRTCKARAPPACSMRTCVNNTRQLQIA